METGEALLGMADLEKYIADNNKALKRENEELHAKLAALKKLMQEPSVAMFECGYSDNDHDRLTSPLDVFKAMTAQMMKEVE